VVRANSITLSLRVKRLSHGEPGHTGGTTAADNENLSHPMNLAPGQAFVVLPKADQDELEAGWYRVCSVRGHSLVGQSA
jgi:hypothetical protein